MLFMDDVNLSQREADELIQMKKEFESKKKRFEFPLYGAKLSIPLVNLERTINFSLDITSSSISITKYNHQNRVNKNTVLLRLDVNGPIHRNPDDEIISSNHLHIYKEGFDDKFAYELDDDILSLKDKPYDLLIKFLELCSIHQNQQITQNKGLFA